MSLSSPSKVLVSLRLSQSLSSRIAVHQRFYPRMSHFFRYLLLIAISVWRLIVGHKQLGGFFKLSTGQLTSISRLQASQHLDLILSKRFKTLCHNRNGRAPFTTVLLLKSCF